MGIELHSLTSPILSSFFPKFLTSELRFKIQKRYMSEIRHLTTDVILEYNIHSLLPLEVKSYV